MLVLAIQGGGLTPKFVGPSGKFLSPPWTNLEYAPGAEDQGDPEKLEYRAKGNGG